MVKGSKKIKVLTTLERNRIHGLSLGYIPHRMKPVHLANNFMLNLTGRPYKLELLNKVSNPKATQVRDGDQYVSSELRPLLIDGGQLSEKITPEEFKLLRSHLNAAYNNDGAAMAAEFAPYKTFGSDYSSPSLDYVTKSSKNHGHCGSFVHKILRATKPGMEFLNDCDSIIQKNMPPTYELGRPLLDDEPDEWEDPYEEVFDGVISKQRLVAISSRMKLQTEALQRLAKNLANKNTNYAARYLMIGVSCWVFSYLNRFRLDREPLLFMDCTGGQNTRVRSQSRFSYSQQVQSFCETYSYWYSSEGKARIVKSDWDSFVSDSALIESLESHYRDLGVRVGVIQPRAHQVSKKHFDLDADSLRVMAMSLLSKDEIVTFPEFANRLAEVWNCCVGARPDDLQELQKVGLGHLDLDDDLEVNAAEFRGLMVRLGLAVEPSDGLALCGLNLGDL